jgi:hypothetical protein
MTSRERFLAIMDYQPVDRMPVYHWAEWEETAERWAREGLARDADRHAYFGSEPMPRGLPVNQWLYPGFPEEVLEETAEYRIIRGSDGVTAKWWNSKSSLPYHVDHLLKGRADWPEFKKRLQPDPARIPVDLDKHIASVQSYGGAISINCAALGGWIRDWMGVENLGYLQGDDPDLLFEMCDTIADLTCWTLDQILPKIKVDLGWGWEDICGRSGPLISPWAWEQCVVPAYKKISAKLRQYGVKYYLVDCDGVVDALIPGWLEGGVNVMFPIEIGVWKADPMDYRNRYGRELRIFGGIDKLEIAKGPAATDQEIERRKPIMRAGGFVPLPDHVIVPETSLADYKYYIDAMKALVL